MTVKARFIRHCRTCGVRDETISSECSSTFRSDSVRIKSESATWTKAYIGPRQQSTVFLTPIREAVYANNIETGKQRHREAEADFSIQNQAWNLVRRTTAFNRP
ncbi:DUF429 domain-containing protein [Halorhabdus rudnickae]|uniref:DUF429 domain-containing protein n=1 Tax=Halorhabdus rudnickae TaxID=1775544 RepID=UPI0037433F35